MLDKPSAETKGRFLRFLGIVRTREDRCKRIGLVRFEHRCSGCDAGRTLDRFVALAVRRDNLWEFWRFLKSAKIDERHRSHRSSNIEEFRWKFFKYEVLLAPRMLHAFDYRYLCVTRRFSREIVAYIRMRDNDGFLLYVSNETPAPRR